jgi:UDP-2,3-diacylglucosamine hydrolase
LAAREPAAVVGVAPQAERAARDSRRWSAAFAADLHLAAADADGVARAVQLVELCALRAARLFLLGDVFDLWTSGVELGLEGFAPLFASLRAARDRGLAVDFLAGNRDFNFTHADGAQVGVAAHDEEELALELDGVRMRLLHGDQLLSDDVAYQRMKRVIRAAPARFLARHLPSALSLAMGRRLRRYSARVAPAKEEARLRLVPATVRARFAGQDQWLLCGHVHRFERVDCGGGRQLLVLPPFFEESRFVVLERGELAAASLDGSTAPLPAARLLEER